MDLEVNSRIVQTDEQGYLLDLVDWSEAFAEKTAGVTLYPCSTTTGGSFFIFRDYFQATSMAPTMHMLVAHAQATARRALSGWESTRNSCISCFERPGARALQTGRSAQAAART